MQHHTKRRFYTDKQKRWGPIRFSQSQEIRGQRSVFGLKWQMAGLKCRVPFQGEEGGRRGGYMLMAGKSGSVSLLLGEG